jgi:peptidoglycan hydrolase CwlO-like protein
MGLTRVKELLAGRVVTLAGEQPHPVEDMRQRRDSPEEVAAMCAAEAESAAAREAELVAARDAEPREAEAVAARREAEAAAVREAQITAARRQRVQGIEGVLLQKFGLAPGMWSR